MEYAKVCKGDVVYAPPGWIIAEDLQDTEVVMVYGVRKNVLQLMGVQLPTVSWCFCMVASRTHGVWRKQLLSWGRIGKELPLLMSG